MTIYSGMMTGMMTIYLRKMTIYLLENDHLVPENDNLAPENDHLSSGNDHLAKGFSRKMLFDQFNIAFKYDMSLKGIQRDQSAIR